MVRPRKASARLFHSRPAYGAVLLFNALRRAEEGVVPYSGASLRPGQTARTDIIVVLAYAAVRVVNLKALECIGQDAVAGGEEGVLKGLLGSETLLRIVLEQTGEELVSFGAQ